MKQRSNSSVRLCMLFQMVIAGVFACCAAVDPLDDSLVFKLGIRGDVNGNGLADAAEIFNAMAASGDHADTTVLFSRASDAEPLAFTNVNYLIGGDGPSRPERRGEGLYFPFSSKVENDKVYVSPAGVSVNTDMPVGNVLTVFTRLRWDGTNDIEAAEGVSKQRGRILFRYNWLYNDHGIAVTMNTRGSRYGFGFYVGKNGDGLFGDTTFSAGEWLDIFFSFVRDPVTEKTKIYSYAYCTTNDVPLRKVGAVREKDWKMYFSSEPPRNLTLGIWGGSSSWLPVMNTDGTSAQNGDYTKCFHGVIKDFQVWKRELTEDERRMVVADSSGAKWRIGTENSSPDEFAADDSPDLVDEYDPDTMPWYKMRGRLTATNPSLVLKGVWSAQDACSPTLPRMLSINPIFDAVAASVPVQVDVNGAIVGTFDLVTPGGRNIYIPASFWNFASGSTVAVTITRVGDLSGTVSVDSIELGGSWQIGRRDGHGNEFARTEWQYDCYFAGNTNSANLKKTIYSPKSDYWGTYLDFKVHVPEDVAERCPFVYETALSSVNGNSGSVPAEQKLGVYVNDELKLTQDGLAQGMPVKIKIEPGELQGGLNVIRLRNLSEKDDVKATCWLQFDYHSLTCKRPASGTVIIVR